MRRGVFLLAAVIVVLATTTVFAVIGLLHASHSSSVDSEQRLVTSLAGKYAEDFTSVDYRHMQSDFANAAKNATPAFAQKYLATVQVFAPLYTRGKVVQTTSVALAGLTSLKGNTAVVLVALNGVARNYRSPTGTSQLFRMQITLTKVGSHWLASNVVPL